MQCNSLQKRNHVLNVFIHAMMPYLKSGKWKVHSIHSQLRSNSLLNCLLTNYKTICNTHRKLNYEFSNFFFWYEKISTGYFSLLTFYTSQQILSEYIFIPFKSLFKKEKNTELRGCCECTYRIHCTHNK